MLFARRMVLVNEDYFNMLTKFGDSKPKDEGLEQQNTDENMVSSLPKTFQPKGKALLEFLKANGITYDKTYRVIVNETPIEGSNYFDILSDLLRFRDIPAPVGFTELAPVLKRINVSRESVPNLERYNYIIGLDSNHNHEPVEVERRSATLAIGSKGVGVKKLGKPKRVRAPKRKWVSW